LGFPTGWSSTGHHQTQQAFSGAVAGEEVEDLCEGSFLHTHPLLCYLFCFTLFIFTCIVLSKTHTKLVTFIVVIFVGRLLSCFIMLSINGWFR
jgi:hypothetical protein